MPPDAARLFRHTLRVPYAHTDQMGVVYYAHYLVYFEMARSAMLREIGLPYAELERRGIRLPVIEAHCLYKAPARFDDELSVSSRCALDGPRLRVTYEIARDGLCLASGLTVHACVSPSGRVLRPPHDLLRLLEPQTPPPLNPARTPGPVRGPAAAGG